MQWQQCWNIDSCLLEFESHRYVGRGNAEMLIEEEYSWIITSQWRRDGRHNSPCCGPDNFRLRAPRSLRHQVYAVHQGPDPDFGSSGRIDLLLSIVDSNRCMFDVSESSPDRATRTWQTIFGWVVGGKLKGRQTSMSA